MLQAKAGDIILVSCGTYYEHDITVKSGVSLWSGTLQPACVTIDAEGKGRTLIFFDGNSKTSVVGFTLTGGLAGAADNQGRGGGILCINSEPKVSNCLIINNQAETGGGIYADEQSLLNLNNCRFEENTAFRSGGGLEFKGESGLIEDCIFKANQALSGAGLSLHNATSIRIINSQIVKNIAGNSGGGILLVNSTCKVEGSVLASNVGGLGGGGLAAFDSTPQLSHCTLYGNDSEKEGCALACADSQVEMNNCQLTFHPGPVLCSSGQAPLLSGCNVFGNGDDDWSGPLKSQAFKRNNISVNPLFCGAESGNFHLSSNSSCLPDNNPVGNLSIIGAYGIGCSQVADNSTPQSQLAGDIQ